MTRANAFAALLFLLPVSLFAQETLQWEKRYSRQNGSPGEGVALARDASTSTLFLAGATRTSGNSDLFIVTYDSAGTAAFFAAYDGPAHGNDRGEAIALDASGNVYVAGSSS